MHRHDERTSPEGPGAIHSLSIRTARGDAVQVYNVYPEAGLAIILTRESLDHDSYREYVFVEAFGRTKPRTPSTVSDRVFKYWKSSV